MKDRWTHNSSYDREITERREGEECNQMEKVVGEREIKTEQVGEEERGRTGGKTRGGSEEMRCGVTVYIACDNR